MSEHSENLIERDIEFFIPYNNDTIKKGGYEDPEERRLVRGIASTADWDLQEEQVLQDGIDYSYLLSHGYFNSEHKPGPKYLVGCPTDIQVTPAGLFVEGYLFKGKKCAEEWWEHIQALAANGSDRVVGWSIQGKTLEKIGGVIKKCWLTALAITSNPINTRTWLEVVKSLDPTGNDQMNLGKSIVSKRSVKVPEISNDLLNYSQAVEVLQLQKGLSQAAADIAVRRIFLRNGIIL